MSKSIDEKVTTDLIETLEDGKAGFALAAEKLVDSDRPDLVSTFNDLSSQRGRFAEDLRSMAAQYGDHIDEDGSLAGALHRGWMSIKDAVAGSDSNGVIEAASKGEAHAVSEYEDALKAEISPRLRTKIESQFAEVTKARQLVDRLVTATD